MIRLVAHEMGHDLGRCSHHTVSGATILHPMQGILLCKSKGMLLPDGRPRTLLCTGMPVAMQKWRRAMGANLDNCISSADVADTDAMMATASLADKALLDALAYFFVRHSLPEIVAGDCPDDCGLAVVDNVALTHELRPFVQQIAANIHMPQPIVHARIDSFRVRIKTRVTPCVIPAAHYDECYEMASDGHVPNFTHTMEYVARAAAQRRETAASGEVPA